MRSQVSLEYLVLLSLVILIIIPLVSLFYVYVSDSIKIAQARDAVRKIADSVEYVSYGGPGTVVYTYVNFPDGINATFVGNHTIMLKLQTTSGIEEVYEDVDSNVVGYLHDLQGYRSVRIINFGNIIQVGQGLLFNPSPIYFELSRGESEEKNDTVKNLLQKLINLNYSLSGDKSSWIEVNNFPSQLAPSESKNFTVNVSVPSDTRSGKYEVDLIAKSNYSYEELPIIVNVIGQLKHLLISFYSDSSYTQKSTKFFPGDTVYYKITSLDEYDYPIDSNISYNLINPDNIIKKDDSRYTDTYLGSFELSRDWSKSHGIWNLSAKSTRVVTITNSSDFEVKASLPIITDFSCNTTDSYTFGWWNSSWEKREIITINSPVNITDYQIKLNITYKNGMSSTFSDVRFTYNNTEIPYWIENYEEGEWAVVWVKTNLTSGNNTIYLYYDNPTANSASNPYSVFAFYDDFNSLDTSKWYVSSGTQYSISNGILNITKGAIGLQNPLPFNLNDGYIVESKMEFTSNSESGYSGVLEMSSSRFTAGSNAHSDATILYMIDSGSNHVDLRDWVGSGSTNSYDISSGNFVFDSNLNTWYVLADSANSTEAAVWKDGTKLKSYSADWVKNMSYISLGAFYGGGTYDIKDTAYDWIRIRKYVSREFNIYYGIDENYHVKVCHLNWWNSSWKYRRWINITETNGVNENNVTLRLLFNGSNIDFSKTNGNDLRFIFNGNEINYWIQYWNQTNESAIIWIKLPYLNAYSTETVWVYYGNPNASSESNLSSVLFYDNMEHGTSNWIYNGLWHLTSHRYDSPTHSFWYGNESTGNYDTGSANSGNLTTSHWIHLYDNAQLVYWEYRQTEQSSNYDHAWVQISTDNSTWTTIDNSYNNDPGSNKTIDLSSYANQNVLIRFYFNTVDQYYNNYEGWYIDDVKVLTYSNEDIKIESDAFWWNKSWSNRVPIQINSSSNLVNYQMKFNIPHEVGMRNNYSDIRFVYWNGTNNIEVPYWIESYNSTDAIVWVKTNLTSGENYIYLYYNNPNAVSISNGSKVFIFFDNFEDWDGWTNYSSGAVIQSDFSYSGNHSLEKINNDDPSGGYKDIGKTIGRDIILEGEVFRNTSWSGGSVDRIGLIDNSGNGYGFAFSHGNSKFGIDVRSSYSPSFSSTSANVNPEGDWYHFELDILSQGNEIIAKYNYSGTSQSYSKTDNSYSSFTRVYVFGGYNYWVDNLWIREYTPNVPTYSIGNVEKLPQPDILYWKISLLDQYNNPKVGYFDYTIYHDNTIYSSQTAVHSSGINGNITFSSQLIGYWKIYTYWTDIMLSNSTEFEVVK